MGAKKVKEVIRKFPKGEIVTVEKIKAMNICHFGIDRILKALAEEGNIIRETGNSGEFVVVTDLRVISGAPKKRKDGKKDLHLCPHCKGKGTCMLSKCKCRKENKGVCYRCNGLGWIYSNGKPFISSGILDAECVAK